MFILSILFCFIALSTFAISFFIPINQRHIGRLAVIIPAILAVLCFLASMFTIIPASNIGVVTTFGKVETETLAEGGHFIAPWMKVHTIYVGMDVASATKSEAASKDLQSVYSDLTVNYHVDPTQVRQLFILNPNLEYKVAFAVPAIYETFKAVVSRYTAEELITKRQEVSTAITAAMNIRLAQYHLDVQTVNLVNFNFSHSFNAAIEEKVTANQKAATAENNLKRVKFEADQRIAQADGEAKAIAIQATAVQSAGGQAYLQLQAISKWDGKLPQYMAAGSPMPFISVK